MNNPYAGIPGPEWDPSSSMYLRDPGSAASSLLIDIGVKPTDGATYRGPRAPQVPEGVNGRWVMTGVNPGPNQTGRDGVPEPYMQQVHGNDWVFMGDRQPMAQAQPEEAPKPQQQASDPSGKTIYNDWDTYRNQARAEVEAGLNSPFVQNPQELIGLDRKQQMQAFYPGAWQEDGVQKVIGPNGKNIAPDLLADGTLALFREGDANTSTARDWPTLVEMLQKTNRVTPDQFQTLLKLGENKPLDQSFGGMGGMGGGGMSLMGNMIRGGK